MDTIAFFLPEPDAVIDRLPGTIDDYWQWQGSATQLTPYWGRYHWVLQTYLYLKQAALPVTLTNSMPRSGVILTHMDCVEYGFRPSPEQYLAIMLVDREVPHPWAPMHILHNPVQRLPLGLAHRYMPPWPQIALLPRAPERGQRFETLGYFGYPNNLHASISDPAFQAEIERIGLRMVVPPAAEWHDFRAIDCIMAVRNFGRSQEHLNKPSLKLLNAWLAGTPAILGHESAYRAEGSPGQGYLEATTPDELLAALRLLKDDPQRRQALVEQGLAAVRQFSVERTVQRWRSLLVDELLPRARQPGPGPLSKLGQLAIGAVRERTLWRRPGWFA